MNVFVFSAGSCFVDKFAAPPRRRRRGQAGGFALVVTLLIVSLLAVVAVSYLTSMLNEGVTANAYTSQTRAAQATQAGVDAAEAILAQSFRDFPDSCTVWDTQQTPNATNVAANTVGGSYNEGTSLYLRAMDTGSGTANPLYTGPYNASDPTTAANYAQGNNPNNLACKTFRLPLISGVPGGYAQLVSAKTGTMPQMNLGETDPTKQNWTDLNIRRFGKSFANRNGDLQGIIGSPATWTSTVGPKPARAYWVNLTGSDQKITGRYAFWIDDESFRTNANYASENTDARFDNYASGSSLTDTTTIPAQARSARPSDMILDGALTLYDATGADDAMKVINTRLAYPGFFLPDPLAIFHSVDSGTGASSISTAAGSNGLPSPTDVLRYLTTTQSGTLNLTRHGTQRLNLDAVTTIDAKNPVTMPEIRKLVEAIRYHLPNWGQRFYRTVNPDAMTTPASTKSSVLNSTSAVATQDAEVYFYKTAANLRDYIDADHQPTIILAPTTTAKPTLYSGGAPTAPMGSESNGPNPVWAQGKEDAPFLQEAVVRYRPAITNSGANYTLTVDYYLEFWNMSDRDVTAAQLGQSFVRISNQQPWQCARIAASGGKPSAGAVPTLAGPIPGDAFTKFGPSTDGPGRDFNLDLIRGVFCGNAPATPVSTDTGVVFKAGTATVITTDPDFVPSGPTRSPVSNVPFIYSDTPLSPAGINLANTYYCSTTTPSPNNRRIFAGATGLAYEADHLRGIMPVFRDSTASSSTYVDYEVEVTMGNGLGYIESAQAPIAISSGASEKNCSNGYAFTWTGAGAEPHNDYLFGGSLGGNGITASELGDPRTNNEQLTLTRYNGNSYPGEPDQNRYAQPGYNDSPPFTLGTPNSEYVQPAKIPSGSKIWTPWPDYFDWQDTAYPSQSLTAATAPSVIANSPLTSIGQLGDIFDPARVIGSIGAKPSNGASRGGGRTLKIGQRDDRYTYDAFGNTSNNSVDNVPASNGWASWRLTDLFCITDPIELPARVNINGVARDGGAALRAALTQKFVFQPTTSIDPLVHGGSVTPSNLTPLANKPLSTGANDTTGFSKLVAYINARLNASPTYNAAGANTPWGPFFERGEFGELEMNGNALFGKNVGSTFQKSNDLAGVDMNRTLDRGREELFRRMAELICTRGDTFTVYAVGQSLLQTTTTGPVKITGTQRMRITFRLVPKLVNLTTGAVTPFNPGYTLNPDGTLTPKPISDPDADPSGFALRFVKPDRYDVQVLEVNSY